MARPVKSKLGLSVYPERSFRKTLTLVHMISQGQFAFIHDTQVYPHTRPYTHIHTRAKEKKSLRSRFHFQGRNRRRAAARACGNLMFRDGLSSFMNTRKSTLIHSIARRLWFFEWRLNSNCGSSIFEDSGKSWSHTLNGNYRGAWKCLLNFLADIRLSLRRGNEGK